jgi:uncharacterized radical SAM protein YgiQ
MFLPVTPDEVKKLGWDALDIIIVTGDTYIDSPTFGAALIGHLLVDAGYRVGIIAQPSLDDPADIVRLGEPKLFWGVTAGSVDSMVANYTALKKFRKSDDYTPGGQNNRRPDRASLAYTNLIRRNFKSTVPIVLGGIEASLRRIAHYDFWDNSVRRSILFDSKADILLYGMAETSVLALAAALRDHAEWRGIPGLCYISKDIPPTALELPSYEEAKADNEKFLRMFRDFYSNNTPGGKTLVQRHNDRYLVQNPPSPPLSGDALDKVYESGYEYDVHPKYRKMGEVRALDTIRFSVTAHRGCYGECSFCAISMHQGAAVSSRSADSIVREVTRLSRLPGFRGVITDIGGPTANMYASYCRNHPGVQCGKRLCLYPSKCPQLETGQGGQAALLRKLRKIPGIKHIFIASGIRYDMIQGDTVHGGEYLREIVAHHISGQMKIAPEHVSNKVLTLMRKPEVKKSLADFRKSFEQTTRECGKEQFLTYYFIVGHPGSGMEEETELARYVSNELKLNPEQAQIFTPTPSTWSSVMYYTGIDPFTGGKIHVERDIKRLDERKGRITGNPIKRKR